MTVILPVLGAVCYTGLTLLIKGHGLDWVTVMLPVLEALHDLTPLSRVHESGPDLVTVTLPVFESVRCCIGLSPFPHRTPSYDIL